MIATATTTAAIIGRGGQRDRDRHTKKTTGTRERHGTVDDPDRDTRIDVQPGLAAGVRLRIVFGFLDRDRRRG